jgi:hypothetical protein
MTQDVYMGRKVVDGRAVEAPEDVLAEPNSAGTLTLWRARCG